MNAADAAALKDAVGQRVKVRGRLTGGGQISDGTGLYLQLNDRALVANYAAIFTPKFRDLIASRVPRQFMRSSEGIMYGRGEVYFDELGKVFALNAP